MVTGKRVGNRRKKITVTSNLDGNRRKKITVTGNRENYHGMSVGRVCGSFFYQRRIPVSTPTII